MHASRARSIAVLGLLLAGCSSGSSDGDVSGAPGPGAGPASSCVFITGGQTTARSLCANCTVDHEELAIDGNTQTFAQVTFPDTQPATGSVRAVAQPGVIFGPLGVAGAIVGFQGGDQSAYNSGVTLRTYLQDVLTGESSATQVSPNIIAGEGSSSAAGYTFLAVAPFDAVEVAYTRVGLEVRTMRVHELCSDF